MKELLYNSIGWVTLDFGDGSKRVFRSSLNEDYLASLGVKPKLAHLYDLGKREFVKIEGDYTVTKEKPELDEFNAFINPKL